MRLVWTRPASADRKEIREYIEQDNPAAALALDELISEKASRLVVLLVPVNWLRIKITF
ncbi:MAG: type II toxin-antitoxin system RelE/ParE family toxin [Burkholderiales bacterium]